VLHGGSAIDVIYGGAGHDYFVLSEVLSGEVKDYVEGYDYLLG
jgi:Ca2+-binding RTX toxin-like protein